MSSWIAVGLGALDLREGDVGDSGVEIAIIPVTPAEPAMIKGTVADLWRRLVGGPVDDHQLTGDEHELVRSFADYGIASDDPHDPQRITQVPEPWLDSFAHELVYTIVAHVASECDLNVVFIKGPVEYRQGLRTRRHSGDVDVWVEPGGIARLAAAMEPWGWQVAPTPFEGTAVNHTTTLRPDSWGCEIDLHRHFPGCSLTEGEAFSALFTHTELMGFCGVNVNVPALPAQAVILALHLMRPEIGRATSAPQLAEAAEVLGKGGHQAAAFARQFGAEAALLRPLRNAFPDEVFDPSYGLPDNWVWRAQPNRFHAYARALRMVPWAQRPRVAWRLLWPTDGVAIDSEQQAGEYAGSAFSAKIKRLRRGVRSSFH